MRSVPVKSVSSRRSTSAKPTEGRPGPSDDDDDHGGGDDGGDDDDDDDDGDGSSGEQGMGVGAAADRKCLVTASRPSTRSMIISTAVPPMIILMAINDHFNNYQY